MKLFITLFISLFFLFQVNVFGQKSISCGLITNFLLTSKSISKTATQSDINLLKKINSDLNIETYLSKIIYEDSKEIIISLYTSATIEEMMKEINFSKVNLKVKKVIKKDKTNFYCYCFLENNKKINRIIFNEPDLTLCIVIDVLSSDINNNNVYFDAILNRISFKNISK
jgi:hypothetical protein